jgi:hypothetical protein
MFFRSIPSVPVRIAYLLTVISFVMTPVHIVAASRSADNALLVFSGGVFVFCLFAGVLHKPRNVVIILYALVAWIIHGLMSPAL